MAPRRSFKVSCEKINGGNFNGRYRGITPKQAANKAFTQILKLYRSKGISIADPIYFRLKETTRKSENVTFHYIGTRKKLSQPITIQYGGWLEGTSPEYITYQFRNKIRSVKDNLEAEFYKKHPDRFT